MLVAKKTQTAKKPITIIHLKQRLTQFLDPITLNQQAKRCKFMQRIHDIQPLQLVTSLIATFNQGNTTSIADLQRQFNGMQLSKADFVAHKPLHNAADDSLIKTGRIYGCS